MKRLNLYLLSGLTMTAGIISCNKTDIPAQNDTPREVTFNIGITPLTRTLTDGLKTTFIENDRIGITVAEYDNIPFTLDSDKEWNGEAMSVSGAATFYAYYPYVAEITGTDFTFNVKSDQSEGYNTSDLLLAKTESEGSEKEIELSFSHALALVEVDAGKLDKTISRMRIQAVTQANVDLTQATATVSEQTPEYVTMNDTGNKIFRAVVPAQTLKAGKRIVVTTDESQFLCNIGETVLQSGKINRFTIESEGEEEEEETNFIHIDIQQLSLGDLPEAHNDTECFYSASCDSKTGEYLETTAIVEKDSETGTNYIKFSQPAGVTQSADGRGLRYHIPYDISKLSGKKMTLRINAKATAGIDLKAYIYTGSNNTYIAGTTTDPLKFKGNPNAWIETTRKDYDIVFDFSKTVPNNWAECTADGQYKYSEIIPENLKNLDIRLGFNHKAGEILIYNISLIPTPTE